MKEYCPFALKLGQHPPLAPWLFCVYSSSRFTSFWKREIKGYSEEVPLCLQRPLHLSCFVHIIHIYITQSIHNALTFSFSNNQVSFLVLFHISSFDSIKKKSRRSPFYFSTDMTGMTDGIKQTSCHITSCRFAYWLDCGCLHCVCKFVVFSLSASYYFVICNYTKTLFQIKSKVLHRKKRQKEAHESK